MNEHKSSIIYWIRSKLYNSALTKLVHRERNVSTTPAHFHHAKNFAKQNRGRLTESVTVSREVKKNPVSALWQGYE